MGEQCPLGMCKACERCLRGLLLHVSLHTHTEMNFRARDNVQGLPRGETTPPSWQQNGGCLETRLEGTGKSLVPHTELNFPCDEQSEPRDREGWQRLVLQGEPTRKTRKLLSCDGCSVMFCAGVGRFQGG